jgi:iron(III) transport system substrate-binding protein
MSRSISRRDVLHATATLAAGTVFPQPLRAAAPPPRAVTPDLIDAARKEGKVTFYTAIDLQTAEKVGKAFETKYPGIAVRVERNGAERIFQRVGQ